MLILLLAHTQALLYAIPASITLETLGMVGVAKGSNDTPLYKVAASLALCTKQSVIVFTAVIMIVTRKISTRGQQRTTL